MKTISIGMCLALGLSASLTALSASAAETISVEVAGSAATRWSSSVMDRHLPFDFAQAQALKLSQKPFRYMDEAEHKKSKAIRNAVIVYGGKRQSDLHQGAYRKNAEVGPKRSRGQALIVRPMT